MLAYVSQKIFLGNERAVSSVCFDEDSELLALGFESGGVKILKLRQPDSDSAELELTLNENLNDAHNAPIATLSWNPRHGKLLSVDRAGLMVVWTESEESYIEEMVNESDEDRILRALWSKDGSYVLIVLERGGAILGNVEGERLWHKKLGFELAFAEFVENDRTIVVSDPKGELAALDVRTGEVFAEYDVSRE